MLFRSNDPTTNVASFDYEGTFFAPVIKSGSYASPSSVLNPAEGMIIYNSTTCKYMGYVSDTGIAGGNPPNSTPGWVDLN